ncbi:2OG-Fe(II) oxygenase [Pseudoroseomonas globiformis]|uniref:2OG-Fe(II) oxygenase n=1 Tax=Teichococcus globiformis TaxID=2307229 RepID=A0ABV7FWP7_9PROT
MAAYINRLPGDPAPYFHQRSVANPNYAFDTAAGRWLVLCFLGSAADAHSQAALTAVTARTDLFDDEHASFFGVSTDPADEARGQLRDRYPGYRFLWDMDRSVSRLYGAAAQDDTAAPLRRLWVVMDPTLRIRHVIPFRPDRGDIPEALAALDALPPPAAFAGFPLQAPVLVLPGLFEPALCQELIALYESEGGEESGFMRDVGGRTVLMTDAGHKKRRDCTIADSALIKRLQERFHRRVVPEIARAFQFQVTRMERYIVSCYAAEEGGHFRAHRDNTTLGTAHRRFAVSVNLNDAFEGGEVSFPEYGPRSFKAPAGGGVVFSCSLLHAVSPVTHGRRFAFLPFLYDEAAAKLREENRVHLAPRQKGPRGAIPPPPA